jgi:hypothetical protein
MKPVLGCMQFTFIAGRGAGLGKPFMSWAINLAREA